MSFEYLPSRCSYARSGSKKNFTGQPDHVVNFFVFIAEEVREIMADLGVKKFDDLIGQRKFINFQGAKDHWKAHNLDLSDVIYDIENKDGVSIFNNENQEHGLDKVLDRTIIKDSMEAINFKKKIFLKYKIYNVDRTVGGMLSGKIAQKYGHQGLPDNTINIDFVGNAGQSFGAWLAKGVSLNLSGDANDYVGKGLSGGIIGIRTDEKSKLPLMKI